MPAIDDILQEIRRELHGLQEGSAALDAQESESLGILRLTLADTDANDRYALRDIVRLLAGFDISHQPSLVILGKQLSAAAGRLSSDAAVAWEVEVARRVVSTHRFLDGLAPVDFGDLTVTAEGDVRLGVGLGLADGSLQHFLTALARSSGHLQSAVALRPYFDTAADSLAEAIDEGRDAVARYFRGQLILRHDSRSGRRIGVLPDVWHTRFGRLAGSLNARRLQLELASGARLAAAQETANRLGLRSLRGLAFAFDVQPLVRRVNDAYQLDLHPESAEGERMVGLADRVLARVHGPIAERWEARIRTLVDGVGTVDGRLYSENRLLGPDAASQPWRFASGALPDSGNNSGPSAVPVEGRDYVVQAGDHLSRIARQVYGGRADYRYLLSHNPHIGSPADLVEGQRVHIPHWPPPRAGRGIRLVSRTPLDASFEGGRIRLPGRSIGPIAEVDSERLPATAKRLTELDLQLLPKARATRLPEGWAVLVENRLIVEFVDADEPIAAAHFGDVEHPMPAWARHVAAQIRGDIILSPGHTVPFGYQVHDPHRRRWVTTALARALADDLLEEVVARVSEDGCWAELLSTSGQRIVRLESEDFDAVRNTPGMRLRDVQAGPRQHAELMTRLWFARLKQLPNDVWLPPVPGMRRYARSADGNTLRLLVPMGTPVFPIAHGTVRHCGPTGRAGDVVLIDHGSGVFSRYMHLATVSVQPGQNIGPERMIGRSGMSGAVSEPGLGIELELRADPSDATWRVEGAVPMALEELLGKMRSPLDRFEVETVGEDERGTSNSSDRASA